MCEAHERTRYTLHFGYTCARLPQCTVTVYLEYADGCSCGLAIVATQGASVWSGCLCDLLSADAAVLLYSYELQLAEELARDSAQHARDQAPQALIQPGQAAGVASQLHCTLTKTR